MFNNPFIVQNLSWERERKHDRYKETLYRQNLESTNEISDYLPTKAKDKVGKNTFQP